MTPAETIDVPKLLMDAQVHFFVENGYLIVPKLISPEEVEELRQDTVKVARLHEVRLVAEPAAERVVRVADHRFVLALG